MDVLSKRQLEVLRMMRDLDAELVYERGMGFVENESVSKQTVFALLRVCAIRHDPYSASPGKGLEIYAINETGLKLIASE